MATKPSYPPPHLEPTPRLPRALAKEENQPRPGPNRSLATNGMAIDAIATGNPERS
ncbi:hypothetical protein TIFTF001_020586 [Ficus carica]|uniref:Uncharacterized protein n=1 Tax=Ficus carica TaxID=3494 RepID=A0AA88DCR8_FICCA|nr:hypothetical protein TIFTF001_020586 [Ficus carica]